MLIPRMTVPLFLTLVMGAAAPAALEASPSSSTISVTEGMPREFAFKVSPTKITSAVAVFDVTNKGKLSHAFKFCTTPARSSKANSCTGVATKKLAPGGIATLTVKLSESGTYEYLSATPSQAASGMKGLLTVLLPAGAPAASAGGTTTPVTTTTTPSSGSKGSSGGVVNGQATDPACGAGTLVPVGPGAGDQDDDNEGGFPTDGDGCL